ncbi:MAG: hypothetical protein P4L51_16470 [Puia sp.]|nr:hypothetical protein [Puia sp.]
MRILVLTIALLPVSAMLLAQGVFSNRTNAVLEEVIQDYPNGFRDLKGEVIAENHQTAEYRSTVQLPGSASCVVSRYTMARLDEYSWTCTVLETRNFENASKKFKELFDQIRNTIIRTGGDKHFILSGQYEAPLEDRKTNRVLFSLLPGMSDVKKLKVDLTLQSDQKGWKILISVYDHPGEEGQGSITDNK